MLFQRLQHVIESSQIDPHRFENGHRDSVSLADDSMEQVLWLDHPSLTGQVFSDSEALPRAIGIGVENVHDFHG